MDLSIERLWRHHSDEIQTAMWRVSERCVFSSWAPSSFLAYHQSAMLRTRQQMMDSVFIVNSNCWAILSSVWQQSGMWFTSVLGRPSVKCECKILLVMPSPSSLQMLRTRQQMMDSGKSSLVYLSPPPPSSEIHCPPPHPTPRTLGEHAYLSKHVSKSFSQHLCSLRLTCFW